MTKFKNETLAVTRPATDDNESKVAEVPNEKTEESLQTNEQNENDTGNDQKMETDFDKDSDKDNENKKEMKEEDDNENDEDKIKVKVKDEDDEENSDQDVDKDKSDESRNNEDHDMESENENENENNKNENNKNESENEKEKVKDEDDNTNDSKSNEPIKLYRVSCTSLNYSARFTLSNLLNQILIFTNSQQTTRFVFAQVTSQPLLFACSQDQCYTGTTLTRIGPFCLMKPHFSTIQCNHLLRWECQCSTEVMGRKCGTRCLICSTIEVDLWIRCCPLEAT